MPKHDTPSAMGGKRCTACGETKSLAKYYLYKSSPDGRRTMCKDCFTARARAWHAANADRANARSAQWRAANPERKRALNAAYEARWPERIKARQERRRDQQNTSRRARRAADPERERSLRNTYRAAHREQGRESTKRWRKANPEKASALGMLKRARKKNAPVVERIDRAAIIARDRSICHICKKPVSSKDMSLDHLVPLASGGDHTAANLAVAHHLCNSHRGIGRYIPAQLRLLD